MGILNFLKGTYSGKVGATVGAKWKNKGTVRTFAIPSNPNTPAQQAVRSGFKTLSSFVSLFSDRISRLTALDTRGMSVRNAIIKLNAGQITAGSFTSADLIISKGGLPNVNGFNAEVSTNLTAINCTWTKATSPSISDKAQVVVVAVDSEHKTAYVESALNSAQSLSLPGPVVAGATLHVYYYLLDYRGSSKVASINAYKLVTAPTP